jgi:hypothetical protein
VTTFLEPKNNPRFGRMISLGDSIIETQDFEGKLHGDSTKKIQEFQEDL